MSQPVADLNPTFVGQLETAGWAALPGVVDDALVDRLIAEIPTDASRRGGLRDLLSHSPTARNLARHAGLRRIAEAVLGPTCFVTRAILFDKTERANWKVPWHQDLTIAVRERVDVAGFGPWSTKEGIVHVQPPIAVLQRMLAVRIHLDDSTLDNGPLRILPSTHRHGRLTPDGIEALKQRIKPIECPIPRGGALLFKPLLLHASSPAAAPAHRRVIHLELAAEELLGGLQWHTRL